MTALPNHRHEHFAQNLASGMTADAAYIDAGYKANRGNAARMNADESIRDRVAQLQAAGAKRVEVTVESLLAEAEEIRALASAAGQFSAALAAVKEKGVLAGVRVEKRETTQKDELSDADLAALITGGRSEDLAAPPPRSSKSH